MNRRNSEMSRQGLFKFSVSRKSAKSKPHKFQKSMKESPVTLDVKPDGLELYIEQIGERFSLRKDNICGLETGRIQLPSKSCWGGGRQEYNHYLMVVLHEAQMSQMILLLTQQSSNIDEDQITTNWKWFIHSKLDFVNSWPNVKVDYLVLSQKPQSMQVTLMLGKMWLSIFKYSTDSLPTFWKYFNIGQISVDLVRAGQENGYESEHCVIKAGKNRPNEEKFVIKSRRRGDIYGYIQTYISPPPTPPRRVDMPPFPSPRSTISSSPSSSSSETEVKKVLYTARNLRRPKSPRSRQPTSELADVYFTLQKVDAYITAPKPSARSSLIGDCRHSLPQDIHGESELPPPTPCGGARGFTALKDSGYLDRPYLSMNKNSPTPSVALPEVSFSIHPSSDRFLLNGHRHFGQGLNYIQLMGPNVNNEAVSPDANFLPVGMPSFQRMNSFQPHLSILYDESNLSSLNLEGEEQITTQESRASEDHGINPELRFEISHVSDKPAATVIKSPRPVPKARHSNSEPTLYPPTPCNMNWGGNPQFCRSFSTPRNRFFQRYRYSTCITDSERHARQMQRWKDELNLTLPRGLDHFYVNGESEHHSLYSGNTSLYERSLGGAYQSSGDDYDLYDLNFLLFPLNNLSVEKKEEVFDWVTVYNKSNPANGMHRNIDAEEISDLSENTTERSHSVERRVKPSRKNRKSLSSTALNDTSSDIDSRRNTEFYSYWSATNICKTLDKIMTNKLPVPDTLGLSRPIRKELCLRLYTMPVNSAKYSWETLAQVIGLEEDSINLVELYIQNHSTKYTAADIVLRHWQFMHNKQRSVEPCTRENLLHILQHQLERHDLVDLLQREAIQTNEGGESNDSVGINIDKAVKGDNYGVDENIALPNEEDRIGSRPSPVRDTCVTTPLKQTSTDGNGVDTVDTTFVKEPFNVAVQNTCYTTPVHKEPTKSLEHSSENTDVKDVTNSTFVNRCETNSMHLGVVKDDSSTNTSFRKQHLGNVGHNSEDTCVKKICNGESNLCGSKETLERSHSEDHRSDSMHVKQRKSVISDDEERGVNTSSSITELKARIQHEEINGIKRDVLKTMNNAKRSVEQVPTDLTSLESSFDGRNPVINTTKTVGVGSSAEFCKTVVQSSRKHTLGAGANQSNKSSDTTSLCSRNSSFSDRIPLTQPKPFVVQKKPKQNTDELLKRSDV